MEWLLLAAFYYFGYYLEEDIKLKQALYKYTYITYEHIFHAKLTAITRSEKFIDLNKMSFIVFSRITIPQNFKVLNMPPLLFLIVYSKLLTI